MFVLIILLQFKVYVEQTPSTKCMECRSDLLTCCWSLMKCYKLQLMRSFFTNYAAGGKPGPTAAQVSPAVIQFISELSVAFNDLLLLNCLTNYLSEEKKVDGNQ